MTPANLPNDTSNSSGDLALFIPPETEHVEEQGTVIIYLNASQIVAAQVLGILNEGPCLTVEGIEDKGKSNAFKGLAALQLL